jgi:hypothetical protein
MAHAELLIKRTFTKADLDKAQEHPSRRRGKPHCSYGIDLVDLRKCVILCPACNSKFDWKRQRFRKEKELPYVVSKCDACKTSDSYCSMYIADETYTKVRSTAEDRRMEARNFWKGRIWTRR